MSNEEHDDWPTFDSVFRELAPDSLTARERLAESETSDDRDTPASLDDAEVQAALEPLPEATDLHFEGETVLDSEIHDEYGFQDEILDLDNAGPDDFLGDTEVPFSAGILTEDDVAEPATPPEEALASEDVPAGPEPVIAAPEQPVDEPVDDQPVADEFLAEDDDGWVNHSPHNIAATEPVVETNAPIAPTVDGAAGVTDAAVTPPAAAMDFIGLFDLEERPLAPIPIVEPEPLDPETELASFDDAPVDNIADAATATAPMEFIEVVQPDPADLLSDFSHLETDSDAPVVATELAEPVVSPVADEPFTPAEPTAPTDLPPPVQETPDAPPPAAEQPPAPQLPTPQPPPPADGDAVAEDPLATDSPTGIDPGVVGSDGTGQPIKQDDQWTKLRAKETPDKITFWENRPKFFGGDERRRARARREGLAAQDAQQDELPQDLPCPACGHLSAADLRDPHDGRLHIRCDSCAHVWSIAGN